jgi:hypothetical protein
LKTILRTENKKGVTMQASTPMTDILIPPTVPPQPQQMPPENPSLPPEKPAFPPEPIPPEPAKPNPAPPPPIPPAAIKLFKSLATGKLLKDYSNAIT